MHRLKLQPDANQDNDRAQEQATQKQRAQEQRDPREQRAQEQTSQDQTANKPVDEKESVGDNQASLASSPSKLKPIEPMKKSNFKVLGLALTVACLLGVATGYGSYQLFAQSGVGTTPTVLEQTPTGTIQVGDVFGSEDKDTFGDQAQGYLQLGGLNGEGSHSLLRPGGESQTVYLTSSVTDLDQFVGMEVSVWGETFRGQKAGWLMDVGRVEVVDTQATAPVAE